VVIGLQVYITRRRRVGSVPSRIYHFQISWHHITKSPWSHLKTGPADSANVRRFDGAVVWFIYFGATRTSCEIRLVRSLRWAAEWFSLGLLTQGVYPSLPQINLTEPRSLWWCELCDVPYENTTVETSIQIGLD